MAEVTFNENTDHYRRNDVRDLDAKEIKRLEEYAKRWRIKNAFTVKGKKAAKPETVTVDTSDDSADTTTDKKAKK